MEWSFDEIRGFIPKSISLPYSREEKNGYRSVLTGRDELNYIMLNGSGSYIVSLCDGKNTVETILNRMCDKFPDANPDMLKSDLASAMRGFSVSRLIGWVKTPIENGTPIADEICVDNGTHIRLAQENDIRLICSLASQASSSEPESPTIVYGWPLSVEQYERPLEVRNGLFNLSKEFFIVYESGRPTGLLGLAPSSNPLLRYADICLLLCPASIAVQCIAAAASFYRQELCDVPNFFHLNLTSKEIASNEGIRNLINEPEFTCAGTFPGECSDGDCMNVYCFSEVC